mmetsp:Transcript_19939/g.50933  ORF Transcript_19939/g.50933 Transcript_19939/m.50933 type:complete len:231 (+) Transcript_19939:363-1055(+)
MTRKSPAATVFRRPTVHTTPLASLLAFLASALTATSAAIPMIATSPGGTPKSSRSRTTCSPALTVLTRGSAVMASMKPTAPTTKLTALRSQPAWRVLAPRTSSAATRTSATLPRVRFLSATTVTRRSPAVMVFRTPTALTTPKHLSLPALSAAAVMALTAVTPTSATPPSSPSSSATMARARRCPAVMACTPPTVPMLPTACPPALFKSAPTASIAATRTSATPPRSTNY